MKECPYPTISNKHRCNRSCRYAEPENNICVLIEEAKNDKEQSMEEYDND